VRGNLRAACGRDWCGPRVHVGAEGATAPETLRQKDRKQQQNIWKETRIREMQASAEGITLSGTDTDGVITRCIGGFRSP